MDDKKVVVMGEAEQKKKMQQAASLLALAAAIGGPYTMQGLRGFARGKPRRVVDVCRCYCCGKSNVTLRKVNDKRVCNGCYAKAQRLMEDTT